VSLPPEVRDAVEGGRSVIGVRADKKPLSSWKGAQERRATVEELPDAPAYAIVTGEISGMFALDFDGEDGLALLERFGLEPHVRSGSGGAHVHVEHPGRHVPMLNGKSARDLGKRFPGLDLKGDGGYVIFCGRNKSGEYELLRDLGDLVPFEALPAELREYLGGQAHVAERPSEDKLLAWALGIAGPRSRNDTGFKLACQLRDNGYTEAGAEAVLRDYAAGFDGTYTEAEAIASVRQAFSQPPREPSWRPRRSGDDEDEKQYATPLDFLNAEPFRRAMLEVERVDKLGRQNARWTITVRDRDGQRHEVGLERSADLMNQTRFRANLYDATGEPFPRLKGAQWDDTLRALHDAAEVHDHGSTQNEETQEWIADFLDRARFCPVQMNDPESLGEVLRTKDDVFRGADGRVYLRLQPFVRFVTVNVGARTTRGDVTARLSRLGFESCQLSARSGDKVEKGRYWRSKPGFEAEAT
jgi:Bifunctional DNA primase/polymerase, N-terminal